MTTSALDHRVAARQSGGPLPAMADNARSAPALDSCSTHVEMGIDPGKIVGIGGSRWCSCDHLGGRVAWARDTDRGADEMPALTPRPTP